jgi:hypothetical protein
VSKFRNEVNNSRYTKALFFETSFPSKETVLYTLKDVDHQGYPSLYLLYMATNDPTEWKFATEYFDGWEHWEMLCECEWFKPLVSRWRRELELRMKSQALARIMAEAKTSSREAFASNKYLLERGWEPKEGQNKRGRPSKAEISKAAHEAVTENNRLSSDLVRLQAVRIN